MPSLEHLVKAQRLYYTSLNFNLSNVLIHSKAADTSWPQGVCVCVCVKPHVTMAIFQVN